MRRLLPGVLCLVSACGGCEQKPEDPARYLSKDAEAAVEVPKLSEIPARWKQAIAYFEGVASDRDRAELETQIRGVFGFDPLTKEGLANAGLHPDGALAIEVVDGGRGALWVLPAKDAAKLDKTIGELVKRRITADQTEQRKAGGENMTVISTKWGPDVIPQAAWVVTKKNAIIGLGKDAPKLVEAALARKPEESLSANAEHKKLAGQLGKSQLARIVFPDAKKVATRAVQSAGMNPAAPEQKVLIDAVRAAGWALGIEGRSVRIDGRLELGPEGLARVKQISTVLARAPGGVLAVQDPNAAVFLYGSGNIKELVALLAPEGSAVRARLDRVFSEAKEAAGIDVMQDVIPRASGHAAVAMGVGDLSSVTDLRAVMQNPASVLWTVAAAGSPPDIAGVEGLAAKADPVLQRRGLERKKRTQDSREIAQIVLPGDKPAVIAELLHNEGAWLFSNDPARTDAMIAASKTPPGDPLDGKAGLFAEVRFPPISRALRQIDLEKILGSNVESVAMQAMVRAFVGKVLALVDRLGLLQARVEAVEDGVSFTARLDFLEVKQAK